MMRPYVGKHFGKTGAPALLLVGESHYLPDGSSQHLSAKRWYSSDSSTLTSVEIDWISTADILRYARSEGFSSKAHWIWKNALWEINENGPRYEDYTRVADDIASYNFFLRPGTEGESLAVGPEDVELANNAFVAHYKKLKPSAVVFLSRLAYNHFRTPAICSVPVIATPHPSSRWWNRVAATYGDRRGRDILAEFIRTLKWRRSALPA
jgi:hypothetical protein